MPEKVVQVEYDDGRKVDVKMKSINYKKSKAIYKLIMPTKIRQDMENIDMDTTNLAQFNEELVKESIVSPIELKTDEGLGLLTKPGFDILVSAASEVNSVNIQKEKNL